MLGSTVTLSCAGCVKERYLSRRETSVVGEPVQPTRRNKIRQAFLFGGFYGFFHLIHLIFVMLEAESVLFEQMQLHGAALLLGLACFLFHHLFSFVHNRKRDEYKRKEIGLLFIIPLVRIIPIHLTIIFGFFWLSVSSVFAPLVLALFMTLKAIADIIMHLLEHVDPHTWLQIADKIRHEDEETASGLVHFAKMLLAEEEYT